MPIPTPATHLVQTVPFVYLLIIIKHKMHAKIRQCSISVKDLYLPSPANPITCSQCSFLGWKETQGSEMFAVASKPLRTSNLSWANDTSMAEVAHVLMGPQGRGRGLQEPVRAIRKQRARGQGEISEIHSTELAYSYSCQEVYRKQDEETFPSGPERQLVRLLHPSSLDSLLASGK